MWRNYDTSHNDRLKRTTKKLISRIVLFAILSFTLMSTVATLPLGAATKPSYKYYNGGKEIGATGGLFGVKTTRLSLPQEGSTTMYVGQVQLPAKGSTPSCIVGLEINVNSTNTAKGSISTPPERNGGTTSIGQPGGDGPGYCGADKAKSMSDFNQNSITITGSVDDTPQIPNPGETYNDKAITVSLYSPLPINKLPDNGKGVKATISNQAVVLFTKNFTFDNEYGVNDMVVFNDMAPATYSVCIKPDKIFKFAQCKSVKKEAGKYLSVEFGSYDDTYRKDGKTVYAAISIPPFKTGVYGPVTLEIINSKGNSIGDVKTNDYTMEGLSVDPVILKAEFNTIEPGKYKVCVKGSTDFCSKKFTKKKNESISWELDVPGPLITIPTDKASQFIKAIGSDGDGDNSCGAQVSGIGWIICPVLSSLTKLDDGMWKLVSGLLNVNPISQNDTIYKAWGSIRSLANVVFVIFFLVIIFSQLTGAGITNYGVKKLLPKIIIAAILVNISFIIIQLAVDLANIIGSSLYNFIVGMAPPYTASWGSGIEILEAGVIGAVGIVGVVAAAGGPTALFFIMLGLALVAALGLITAVLTLIFRQAAILVLAIMAPLAFVAYLLPNTESWFKKWRGLLLSMLFMYPMAALIFAGAQFASATIIGDGKDFWNLMIGLTMMALPLFSLPFIARQGGAILSRVNGAISGVAQRANQPIRNWSKSHSDAAAAEYRADNGRRGMLGRYSPSRHLSRAWTAGRMNREARTAAAQDEFKSQLNNNQVRGVTGRRINGEATADRATAAKNALSNDSADSANRVVGSNPAVNARHGGTNLNERAYATNKEKDRVEGRRDEALEGNHDFDIARRAADHAKSDAKAATDRAAAGVERDPTTLQVRANAAAGAKTLSHEQGLTDQYLTEAKTSRVADANSPVAGLQAATRTELREGSIGENIAKSAEGHAERVFQQEYEEIIAPPSPVGTMVPPTAEAVAAAGIEGGIGITNEQAAKRAAIEKRGNEDVAARASLIASTSDAATLVGVAGTEFDNSFQANDAIGVRAAIEHLAKTTGGPGKRRLGAEISRIPAGDVSDATESAKGAVLAAGIKGSDVSIASWATDDQNRDLAYHRSQASTYSGLTPEETASQTIQSIARGIISGGITPENATATLTNGGAAKNLDPDKRAMLNNLVADPTWRPPMPPP